MPSEVILPRVDMDMATGKISKWLVPSGASVTKGQPLFEIETDKATMEIEAEADGTIRDLVDASGKDIAVGSVVAWIFAANEAATAAPAATPPAPAPAPATNGAGPRDGAAVTEPLGKDTRMASPLAGPGDRVRATPLARRMARQHAVTLGEMQGSGPRGRVRAADVLAFEQARSEVPALAPASAPARAPAPAPAPTPERDPEPPIGALKASEQSAAPPRPHASTLKRLREGSGTPLLLVHGFGSEANGWRPFLPGVTTAQPVLGLDLPGHGTTPLGAVASFDDLVDAVGAILADLEGRVDVMAHSLGAAVMAAVAARGLVDVRSLLLLSPAGLGPDINGSFIQGFLSARSEAALSPWMGELVADTRVMTPSLVRATLKARDGTDQVAAQRQLAAAIFPDGAQSFSIRPDLAQLRGPVRIVFGTEDKIIPARHATGLPPLAALHRLPGVGHMPHLEARDLVATLLAHDARP